MLPVLKYIVPALIVLLILAGVVFFIFRGNNAQNSQTGKTSQSTQQNSSQISNPSYQPVKGIPEKSYSLTGIETGQATISGVLNQTLVSITLSDQKGQYPTFVYAGTCSDLGQQNNVLSRVINGKSQTSIDRDLNSFFAQSPHQAIAVSDIDSIPVKIISCADIN